MSRYVELNQSKTFVNIQKIFIEIYAMKYLYIIYLKVIRQIWQTLKIA